MSKIDRLKARVRPPPAQHKTFAQAQPRWTGEPPPKPFSPQQGKNPKRRAKSTKRKKRT